MKFQRLTILASAVILGLGLSSGAYAFSAEMTKSYSQGDKASFLAGAHNQKGISCQMCHTTDKVSDSETEINKQCVMCHEPNALVKKTEKPHQPNPHMTFSARPAIPAIRLPLRTAPTVMISRP